MSAERAYRECEAELRYRCCWRRGGKDGPIVSRYRIGRVMWAWGHAVTWTTTKMLACGMRLDELESRMPDWWHRLMGRKV